jgi:hypothetical protein
VLEGAPLFFAVAFFSCMCGINGAHTHTKLAVQICKVDL